MWNKCILFLLLAAPCSFAQDRNYFASRTKAVNDGQALVVGVGCAPPSGDWLTSIVRTMEGFQGPCIVVTVPSGDDMIWVKVLPASAGSDSISKFTKVSHYTAQRQLSIKTGRPLVIGVGVDPPEGDWLTTRKEPPWFQYSESCVVVTEPKNGNIVRLGVLAPGSDRNQVSRFLSSRQVPSAMPSSMPIKYRPQEQPNFQERFNRQSSFMQFRGGSNC